MNPRTPTPPGGVELRLPPSYALISNITSWEGDHHGLRRLKWSRKGGLITAHLWQVADTQTFELPELGDSINLCLGLRIGEIGWWKYVPEASHPAAYTAGKGHDRGFMAFDGLFHLVLCGASLGAGAGRNFFLAAGSQKHAEKLKEMRVTGMQILTLPKEQRKCAAPSQRRANAMASVGPTPVKRHEPTVMALAGCDTKTKDRGQIIPPGGVEPPTPSCTL
ncbi:hypothetical protein B0H16DRAFT_1464163 [Mycena metata]|uniref:Uncharacterized protein n=1 Tax=Mycena metata TaxID=1033252 RepID=A0AAD7N320_9AGAR|nr:hypothetical protein B0H16DRAFT_1464163 [Mycena metata]